MVFLGLCWKDETLSDCTLVLKNDQDDIPYQDDIPDQDDIPKMKRKRNPSEGTVRVI